MKPPFQPPGLEPRRFYGQPACLGCGRITGLSCIGKDSRGPGYACEECKPFIKREIKDPGWGPLIFTILVVAITGFIARLIYSQEIKMATIDIFAILLTAAMAACMIAGAAYAVAKITARMVKRPKKISDTQMLEWLFAQGLVEALGHSEPNEYRISPSFFCIDRSAWHPTPREAIADEMARQAKPPVGKL